MTKKELAKMIAKEFISDYILENGFEDFNDMCKCYQYDSKDIKAEVIAIAKQYNWYGDVEETDLYNFSDDGEMVSYKSLNQLVRNELKKQGY